MFWLVTPENVQVSKETFGGGLDILDATPDLQHVVFRSGEPLLSRKVKEGEPAEREEVATKNNLYEWSAGLPVGEQLKLINVLPGGGVAFPASS